MRVTHALRAVPAVLPGMILASLLHLPTTALSQTGPPPVGASTAQAAPPAAASAIQALSQVAGAEVSRSPVSGLVTFLSMSGNPITLALAPTADPEARARAFLATYGSAFGIASAGDVALFRSEGPDLVGMEHVRFKQLYGGVPVTAGELTVHLRGASVIAVNAKTLDLAEKIPTTPSVSDTEAVGRANALVAKHFGVTNAVLSTPRLEVFNRGMLEGL